MNTKTETKAKLIPKFQYNYPITGGSNKRSLFRVQKNNFRDLDEGEEVAAAFRGCATLLLSWLSTTFAAFGSAKRVFWNDCEKPVAIIVTWISPL